MLKYVAVVNKEKGEGEKRREIEIARKICIIEQLIVCWETLSILGNID